MSGGLIIRLRPHEKFLVNGVVIENGEKRSRLRIKSQGANILRLRDALHPSEATTPVKRLYYVAQLIVTGDIEPDDGVSELTRGLDTLYEALSDPKYREHIESAQHSLNEKEYYHVLRALRLTNSLRRKAAANRARKRAGTTQRQCVLMFFQPAVGLGGYSGWLILERSEARQRETFERSPALARDIEYFRENIKNALTAEDLVTDRRLLTVALGAFGLSDEIDKRAFVRKILEEGTEDSDAFANRLNEPRFRALAEAFGYGNIDGGSSVLLESFREDIIARFKVREFDRAVGEVDNDMRLALNFRRDISSVVSEESSETTKWFQIMGQQPLREVLAVAFNIPQSVGQLDIDRQQEIFADRALSVLGTSDPAVLNDPEIVDDMLQRFFLIRQTQNGPSSLTPGFSALTLLQGGALGSGASQNLFLSQV